MNSIRFTGLASGLDTQSIVDSMMRVERMPLDKLHQQKQVLEWQRDDYREMNKLLKEFDTLIFDTIYRQANMLKRKTTTSDDKYVTATASADAGNVSYKIENVKLATAARRISTGEISGKQLDPKKSLWSQTAVLPGITWKQDETDTTESFTVPEGAGKEYQLSKGALSDIKDGDSGLNEIKVTNSEGTSTKTFSITTDPADLDSLGENQVYINEETGKMTFGADLVAGDTFKVSYKQNYVEFAIKTHDEQGNPQYTDFKFDGTTSLNQMFNTINTSSAGVNVFYDEGTDKVVMSRKLTGDLNPDGDEIQFLNSITRNPDGTVTEGDSTNNFFTDVLKLGEEYELNTDGSYKMDSDGNFIRLGTDVTFTINGLTTTRKSNTFTMNGVTFTLKKEMTEGESALISTSTDTEAIFGTIKDFVDKYNEMIEKINGKLTEERQRSFTPLTDEQKSAMSEKEIEDWEKMAKAGLIRRDSILTSGLGTMRMDLYTQVVSNSQTRTHEDYNQLAEIGIKTSTDYLERGKLEIDEDKLKAAIENNPEAVYQLFMAEPPADAKSKSEAYQQTGLARRLRDTIDNTMEKIEAKAGNSYTTEHNYSMGKNLLRIKDDIATWEDRLKQIEQRYWNQYTAMEKAMQQLNNQSNQLLAQLTSMQGS